MSLLKCKCCGGDLDVKEGEKVVICPYCGSQQTIPDEKNEQFLKIYARGNRLRSQGEFDKAYSMYSQLLTEGKENAEVYWNLLLCKYGITYVDDYDGKKKPTINRRSRTSILDDDDYKKTIELSDAVSKEVYEQEAEKISDIQKGILKIVQQETPYDIFISYKETDESGDRTKDSVLAQDIYDSLTKEGYRVFLSRVSLANIIGREYEPYIYSALYTAKMMLLVTTDEKHANSVWVKNEWTRFVERMKTDSSKILIPCYCDRNPYNLPKELRNLQGVDRGKLGFIQDLKMGIEKILCEKKPVYKSDNEYPKRYKPVYELPREKSAEEIEKEKRRLIDSKYEKIKQLLKSNQSPKSIELSTEERKEIANRFYNALQQKSVSNQNPIDYGDPDYFGALQFCYGKVEEIKKMFYMSWINCYKAKSNVVSKDIQDIKKLIDLSLPIKKENLKKWLDDADDLQRILVEMNFDPRSRFKDFLSKADDSLPLMPFDEDKSNEWLPLKKNLPVEIGEIFSGYEFTNAEKISKINIVSIKSIFLEKGQCFVVADKIYVLRLTNRFLDPDAIHALEICQDYLIFKPFATFFHALKQNIFEYYWLDGERILDYQGIELAPEDAKKIQRTVDDLKNLDFQEDPSGIKVAELPDMQLVNLVRKEPKLKTTSAKQNEREVAQNGQTQILQVKKKTDVPEKQILNLGEDKPSQEIEIAEQKNVNQKESETKKQNSSGNNVAIQARLSKISGLSLILGIGYIIYGCIAKSLVCGIIGGIIVFVSFLLFIIACVYGEKSK